MEKRVAFEDLLFELELKPKASLPMLKFFVLSVIAGFLFFSGTGKAEAATPIYRSVGPNNTSNLNATDPKSVTIIGNMATFSGDLPANVGVGDVIQYNPGTGLNLAFIDFRYSSHSFSVQSVSGGSPMATGEVAASVFRAYTSLSNAESGTENTAIDLSVRNFDTWTTGKNLVSSDQQWYIACYGDAADETATGVEVNGWTTDDDNFIKIFTPYGNTNLAGISQRHNGVWDNSKYRLVTTDTYAGSALSIGTGAGASSINVEIEGLQIYSNGETASGIYFWNVSGGSKASNNIIKSDGSMGYGIDVGAYSNTGTTRIWNNLIYGIFDGAIHLDDTGVGSSAYVYNNTAIGIGNTASHNVGYDITEGNFIAKNNIAQNYWKGYRGTFDGSSTKNLSDLADAPGTAPINNATLTFKNSASNDYRLASSDTSAINQGVDLSGDTYIPFSYDFQSQNRVVPWDVGADEDVDTVAPTITAFVIPTYSTSLIVPISTFTATDDTTVTGYMLTESSIPPSAGDSGWSGTPQTTYTFSSQGSWGLYAWAKDAAGNVSEGSIDYVFIDTAPPTVAAFTIPETSTSLDVLITTFTATDNYAVTGYKLTESSTPPSAGDSGWSGSAQTLYTFSTQGSKTLYAWAKDATGNVSTSLNDSVIITLPGDTLAPAAPTGLSVR